MEYYSVVKKRRISDADPSRQGLCVVAAMNKFTQTTEVLWRKRGQHSHSLSEREGPDPCLDRLLLFLGVHYIEGGPHLLCTGSLLVVTFYRKQRNRCCQLHQRRIFANTKGKVIELVTLIFGRFSIDFRKLL